MISIVLLAIAIPILLAWIWRYATKNHNYFKGQPLPVMSPNFQFGITWEMLAKRLAPPQLVDKIYTKYAGNQIVGIFDFLRPFFMLRDPELIKHVGVKEFDHFIDHRSGFDDKMDPILGKSLIALKGQAWKEMRSTLSPAFTGSKMRLMFELVSSCGDQLGKYFGKKIKPGETEIIEVKEYFSRFANDVIASCAFGIEVDSLENRNNDFFLIGERLMNFATFKGLLKVIGMTIFPRIMQYFEISLMSKADTRFFKTTILDTIKIREEKNIVRPDMINLLMNARKGQLDGIEQKNVKDNEFSAVEEQVFEKTTINKLEWTDNELIGQCLIFFLAGFDTSSTALSFIAYELAINPDIREKLQSEIDDINEQLNGKMLNYDTIQKMKYLDMVVSETLRKWPPAPFTDRSCAKDFDLKTDEGVVKIRKGDNVWIPIFPIHRDPQYYPDPEKFDPERFSDERKHEINPGTYLPFGVGPRNCIGSRFALMEVKAAIYYLLLHFDVIVCEKTEIPLKMGVKKFRMLPDDGIFVGLKPRVK